jgi:death-on-curing protein
VIFPTKDQIVATQARLIAEFGGDAGFLNESSLDSALAAAQQRAHYEGAGIAVRAATYRFHVTKAHAFVDGNKRVAAAAADVFPEMNGSHIDATDVEFHALSLAIASSAMTRDEIDAWMLARVRDEPSS